MIDRSRMYKHFFLSVFLISPVHSKDVWDYAQERTLRVEQPKRVEQPQRGQKSNSLHAEEFKKKNINQRIEKSNANNIEMVLLTPHQKKDYNNEAVSFGEWIKKVINALKLTPPEKKLKEKFNEIRSENINLTNRLASEKQKIKFQQKNLELVQHKLKELQNPSVPKDDSRKEIFVAGMASGYDLLELINQRKKLGIEMNNEDFISGVKEVLTSGNRISYDEFTYHLNRINNKIKEAEQILRKQREAKDLEWVNNFKKENGSIKSKDGVWYQVNYKGDRSLNKNANIIISLNRKLSSNEIVFDSEIYDKYIEMNSNNVPDLLKDILANINLHGEVVVAMPVDDSDEPDINSKLIEIWTIRIVDTDEK